MTDRAKEQKDKVAELVAAIEKAHPVALSGDYLALLGVDADTSEEEVKTAFFRKARIFHPDVLARYDLDPAVLEKGRYVFKTAAEAYNTLIDPGRRAAYLARARRDAPATSEKPRSPEEEAEIYYHKAQILLRRGNHREAIEFLKRALQLRKDEFRYLLDLGWTIFNNPDMPLNERLEEAKAYFERVLDKNPNHSRATYYMALYYKARNQTEEAYSLLRDCLTLDPQFTPARRELRLLRLRLKKERERMKNPFYRLKKLLQGGGKG